MIFIYKLLNIMITNENGKYTDGELLANMIEELDSVCVKNEGDDYKESAYYYNGQYTDYGMDVTTLKGLKKESTI